MSDIPSSGATTPVQPVTASAQSRSGFGAPRDGSLENLPKSLLSNPRDVTLRGEVVGRNEDGSTRIQTPRGPVNVRLAGEILERGQRVELDIPAGSPPANTRVRAETPAQAQPQKEQAQTPQPQAQPQTRQEQTAQAQAKIQADQAKSQNQAEQTQPSRQTPPPTQPPSQPQAAPPSSSPPPVSPPAQGQTSAPQNTAPQGGNAAQAQPAQGQPVSGQSYTPSLPPSLSSALPPAVGAGAAPLSPPSGLPPSGLPVVGGQVMVGTPVPLQVGQYVQLVPVQGAFQPAIGAEAGVNGQGLPQALSTALDRMPLASTVSGAVPIPIPISVNGPALSIAQAAGGVEGITQPLQGMLSAGFGVSAAGAALSGASLSTSLGANGVVDGLIRAFLTFGTVGGTANGAGAQVQSQTQTLSNAGSALQGGGLTASSGGVLSSAALAGNAGIGGGMGGASKAAGLSVAGVDFEALGGSQGLIRVAGSAVTLDARVVDIMRPSVLSGAGGAGTGGASSGVFSGANAQPGQITAVIGSMVQGGAQAGAQGGAPTGARMSVSLFDGGRPLAGQFLLPAGLQGLPEGTELRLDVVQAQAVGAQGRAVGAPMAGLSGLYQALGLMDSGWGDMAEFLNIVAAKLPPVDAQAAMRIMPQIGGAGMARFTTPVLFFLAALRGGDMTAWMGERNSNLLRGEGRSDLIGRLERGFSALGKSFREPVPVPGGELRSVSLPMLFGPDLSRLQFHVRDYHGDGENGKDGDDKPDRRIVIDFSLSRMGDMQIDSLLIGQRMETVLRTQTSFSEAMRQDLRKRYADVMRGIGYQGHLDFSAADAAE